MPTTVGEEIRPAGASIGSQSGREGSLMGRGFPDDHVIGGVELAGAGIDHARAGGGKRANLLESPDSGAAVAGRWPGVVGNESGMHGGAGRGAADGGRRRLTAARGERNSAVGGGDCDQKDDFGR